MLSSDHVGITKELARLERSMLRTFARLDDARDVRDCIKWYLDVGSTFCAEHGIDMRGWMERTRKRAS